MQSIKIYRLMITVMLLCGCFLNACGGGGASNGNGTNTGIGTQGIAVSGRVSANIVYPGTVRIYGVNADGSKKTPALVSSQIQSDGSYSVSLGGYQGAIVGIAFGRYTDEATKTVIDIPESNCLSAALQEAEVRGKTAVTLHISPLSDLAYQLVRPPKSLDSFLDNIATSNLAIANLFGVDLAATAPVLFDAVTFADSTTTGAQVRLTTLLAVLSQFSANGSATPLTPGSGDLQAAITTLVTGITVVGGVARLSPELAYLLQQAGARLATNSNTQPVLVAGGSAAQSILSTIASLGSVGTKKMARFRLRTTGSFSGSIYGISVKISLPAGFVLRTDPSGLTQTGVVVASGQSGTNSTAFGSVAGSLLTIGIGNPNGFGLGEFVTVYGEISAASTPPLNSEYTPVTEIKISDEVGSPISGIAVEVF